MGEFFKGWRRKIGVVTLAIALFATGGWIRSLYTGDIVLLALGPFTLEAASRQSEFRFVVYRYFNREETGSLNSDRTSWNRLELPPPKKRNWSFRKAARRKSDLRQELAYGPPRFVLPSLSKFSSGPVVVFRGACRSN